jgi:hypothetical protein
MCKNSARFNNTKSVDKVMVFLVPSLAVLQTHARRVRVFVRSEVTW